MEGAITARLERVVQEVVEVRQRAQSLSDELEQVRAERGVLLATLEEERAVLASARVALEEERTRRQESKSLPPLDSTPQAIEELQAVTEPEAELELAAAPLVAEVLAPRLPSPRKLLGKLKFVGRNKGKAEELAMPTPIAALEDEFLAEQVEQAETIEFVPVALLEEEPAQESESEREPVVPAAVEKPRRVSTPRNPKAKKVAPPPRFAPREFLASLPGMDDDQLDLAAFGIAQLDDSGGIVALNHQGAALLGTGKNEVLDQMLFTSLLPDTGAQAHFTEGTLLGKLDTVLLLEGGMVAHLFRHGKSRTNWALLRKQQGGEA